MFLKKDLGGYLKNFLHTSFEHSYNTSYVIINRTKYFRLDFLQLWLPNSKLASFVSSLGSIKKY